MTLGLLRPLVCPHSWGSSEHVATVVMRQRMKFCFKSLLWAGALGG